MPSCRIQESKKKKARRSINCMFLGWMMKCVMEIESEKDYCTLRICYDSIPNQSMAVKIIENVTRGPRVGPRVVKESIEKCH